MVQKNPSCKDLTEAAGRLAELMARVGEGLGEQITASSEVDGFIAQTVADCTRLEERLTAVNLAKRGLESIIAAHDSQLDDGEDQSGEVDQLRPILEEKRVRLDRLEAELSARIEGVHRFLADLDRLQGKVSSDLEALEEALRGVREARRAQLKTIDRDRAKILTLLDRFRPPGQRIPDLDNLHPLSVKAVGSAVDRILDQMAPSRTERMELLESLAQSVKDESLRQILSDKLAETEKK